MSNVTIDGVGRRLLASFVDTAGPGSLYTSAALDVAMYKSVVGLLECTGSHAVLTLKQSGVSSVFDVSSAFAAVASATAVVSAALVGQYFQAALAVSSSTSQIRCHIYGVPI